MSKQQGSGARRARVARHIGVLAAIVCAVVVSMSRPVQTQSQTYGMTIPSSQPRLWFNTARLATARQWFQANPFTPNDDDPVQNSLAGLLGNNATYCRRAIDWVLGFTISDADLASTSSNDARWFGEQAFLAYDWCYGHMTPTERSTVMNRWNYYNDTLRQKAWGGPLMWGNNYHWGYLRNELAWAITSYGENSMADTFFQDALVTRWQQRFVPYGNPGGTGAGGVVTEGSQYGPYLLGYGVVPFQSAEMHGRSIYTESEYHRGAVLSLIYGTTPGTSTHRGSGVQSGYEMFPYSDDDFWGDGRSAHDVDFGSFMTVAAMRWSGSAIGRWARNWINTVQPTRYHWVRSVDAGGTAESFSSLPTDYFAPGAGTFFLRSNWNSNATAVHLMLGNDAPGTGHGHEDWGFQIWRGGRWLSRETTAYTHMVAGHAGGAAVPAYSTHAHNGILVNGQGSRAGGDMQAPAAVTRLHRTSSFAYAATDLTGPYRAPTRPSNDNPAVGSIVREFLFIRPLETLVILDRVSSNAVGTTPAANIPKTFLAHFENAPQVTSTGRVLGTNGTQALRLMTLAPANAVYRVIDEASSGGSADIAQYRLEVETSGQAQSYFLHVLQARDASGTDVTATLEEDATTFRVNLSHPTGGTATVVFNKGMTSTGGTVTVGTSPAVALLGRVQGIQVTDNGPVWENETGGGGSGGPSSPTGLRIVP